MDPNDVGKDAPRSSGAPEAGGAVTRGSRFGGGTLTAQLLRLVARVARDIEASAYRRLRDLDLREAARSDRQRPGAPRRAGRACAIADSSVPIR